MSEKIREALVRAYCYDRNAFKTLDPDLVEDMAKEVEQWLAEQSEELPRRKEVTASMHDCDGVICAGCQREGENAVIDHATVVIAKLKDDNLTSDYEWALRVTKAEAEIARLKAHLS